MGNASFLKARKAAAGGLRYSCKTSKPCREKSSSKVKAHRMPVRRMTSKLTRSTQAHAPIGSHRPLKRQRRPPHAHPVDPQNLRHREEVDHPSACRRLAKSSGDRGCHLHGDVIRRDQPGGLVPEPPKDAGDCLMKVVPAVEQGMPGRRINEHVHRRLPPGSGRAVRPRPSPDLRRPRRPPGLVPTDQRGRRPGGPGG